MIWSTEHVQQIILLISEASYVIWNRIYTVLGGKGLTYREQIWEVNIIVVNWYYYKCVRSDKLWSFFTNLKFRDAT